MQETVHLLYRDGDDSFHVEEQVIDGDRVYLVCNDIVYSAPPILLSGRVSGYIRIDSVNKPVNPD